jgi:arylformamidase
MKILDISRTLSNDLAPWPGDTGFTYKLNGRIEEGASVNVGAISMSLHNGTHADARFHFESAGWKMDQAVLDTYIGPAIVVDLSGRYAGLSDDEPLPHFEISDLEGVSHEFASAPRLLLKTGVFPDTTNFPKRIPVIAPGVADWLKEQGVKLLGLDIPSVDEIDSKDLANHHALGAAGYNFVAMPLKIAGGDGSPVRAILWRD